MNNEKSLDGAEKAENPQQFALLYGEPRGTGGSAAQLMEARIPYIWKQMTGGENQQMACGELPARGGRGSDGGSCSTVGSRAHPAPASQERGKSRGRTNTPRNHLGDGDPRPAQAPDTATMEKFALPRPEAAQRGAQHLRTDPAGTPHVAWALLRLGKAPGAPSRCQGAPCRSRLFQPRRLAQPASITP